MTKKGTFRTYVIILTVAGMLLCLVPVLFLPVPAVAAATTSLTVTKYDAHGNVLGTQTVDYQWMEANLPVQGDGAVRYYAQGPTFDTTDFDCVWNPGEDVNVDSRDYGCPKGTDVKDLCGLVGGATPGCTVKIKAADNFYKWFDYEDVYNPEPEQGKLVVCWYNADYGGYVPAYDTGMRLLFFADTSVNPNGWHVFGDWDMHETLPESRWHYYAGQWPSSSGLSVQIVSNIDIYEPNLVSCDAAGNAKDDFAPGETVYVKGLGMAASTSYKLWIQPEPVSNNRLLIEPGETPSLLPAYEFQTSDDPSGAQETITADASGDFGPTAIWSIPPSGSPQKYDIIADSQALGTIGKLDSRDYIDSPGWQGFSVTTPPSQVPVADFSVDVTSGYAPLTVRFTDQSTENPTSWAWDFDDDGIVDSTSQDPSHTYSTAGTYSVTLTVANALGEDSITKDGFISATMPPLPVAGFEADMVTGAAPLTVHFTDQSTGNPTAWAWDFNNDGIVDSTGRNPTYTYEIAGNYSVRLTVTNLSGSNSATRIDYITVTVPPLALVWGPYLTGTSTTSTTINVKATVPVPVTVEYATKAEYEAGSNYSHTASSGVTAQQHHIPLTGLEADTAYHYRVLYGSESTGGYTFRTFPASGPVRFVVLSDSQDQLPLFSQSERFKLVADSIAGQPDVAFVVIAGDLVNDGSDTGNWDRFFEAGREMLPSTTLFTALGNHEGGGDLYMDVFGYPRYYSFDCGNVHFVILDSNSDTFAQTPWLGEDLAGSKDWKFVAFHHPFYTSQSSHFGGWENLRSDWEETVQTHGVHAVWNGHVHAYERYLQSGIQYMVLGTGGGPLYELSEVKYEGYQNSLENSLAYALVTIGPDSRTASVEIIRVADISVDNADVTMSYPSGTVFETVLLTRSVAESTWLDWLKDNYVFVVAGVGALATTAAVVVAIRPRRRVHERV